MRARAPVAASSAHRVHRVLHAPCLARLADLVRSSATAAITETTFRVALGDSSSLGLTSGKYELLWRSYQYNDRRSGPPAPPPLCLLRV